MKHLQTLIRLIENEDDDDDAFLEKNVTKERRIQNLMDEVARKIKFTEKPSYWEEINQVSAETFGKIEEASGFELKRFSASEIFDAEAQQYEDHNGYMPLQNATWPKDEFVFIIEFHDDQRWYLVDSTGARSYIRFWVELV